MRLYHKVTPDNLLHFLAREERGEGNFEANAWHNMHTMHHPLDSRFGTYGNAGYHADGKGWVAAPAMCVPSLVNNQRGACRFVENR